MLLIGKVWYQVLITYILYKAYAVNITTTYILKKQVAIIK